MTKVLVAGGTQRDLSRIGMAEEWRHYREGVVALVELASGSVHQYLTYVSPPDVCPPGEDSAILFKAATLEEDRLYLCTQTEVMVYRLSDRKQLAYVSLPCFNDVHHVCPGPNGQKTLLVACTGLDMVVEIDEGGSITREWDVLGRPPWQRFTRSVDYRKVPTTKPHESHPNFVFLLGDEIWTTRHHQGDAVCLTQPQQRRIDLHGRLVHDGLVEGEVIYFTSVDGHVLVVDAERHEVVKDYDLNVMAQSSGPLGWCRGLEVIDERHILVGFTRLRPTRWRQNVAWLKHKLGGHGANLKPTRLALFDLQAGKLCWEGNLEPFGVNAVFSVHRLSDNRHDTQRAPGGR